MKAVCLLALLFGVSEGHRLHHQNTHQVHHKQRQEERKWGVIEEEDTTAYQHAIVDASSNEVEYQADAPVGYEAVHIKDSYPTNTLFVQKTNKKWGEIDEEDTPEYLKDQVFKHSHPPGYVADSPKGYEAVEDVQLRARQGKWGEVDEEDTTDYLKDVIMDSSHEEDYVTSAPKGYNAIPYDKLSS